MIAGATHMPAPWAQAVHFCGRSPTAARLAVSVSGPRGRWQRSVFGVSRHGYPAGKPLNRAAGGRFGDVFAPERLFVSRPALEFLAVADPLNPVVLREDHLDGAGRERVRPENLYRWLGLGSPSQSDCHATSIISLGCGLSVDYLWVALQFPPVGTEWTPTRLSRPLRPAAINARWFHLNRSPAMGPRIGKRGTGTLTIQSCWT